MKELFTSNGINFEINLIYQEIESESGKILYFVSHEKRFSELEACMNKKRGEFRDIRFFEVKPLLMLKEGRHLKEAITLLLKLKK